MTTKTCRTLSTLPTTIQRVHALVVVEQTNSDAFAVTLKIASSTSKERLGNQGSDAF